MHICVAFSYNSVQYPLKEIPLVYCLNPRSLISVDLHLHDRANVGGVEPVVVDGDGVLVVVHLVVPT